MTAASSISTGEAVRSYLDSTSYCEAELHSIKHPTRFNQAFKQMFATLLACYKTHVEPSADAQHRHSRREGIIRLMGASTMELIAC